MAEYSQVVPPFDRKGRVAEWFTRWSQKPMGAIPCGFESHLAHNMPLKPITFEEKDLKKLFKLDTPMARIWRKVRKFFRSLIWFITIFGITFFALNSAAFWQRADFASGGREIDSPPLDLPTPISPTINYEPEIIIPKIGVQAPVIYDASYSTIIEQLRGGVVKYEGTADPGQVGNVVIVGHSSDFPWSLGKFKTVFALLDKLTIGDEIILPHGPNRYIYKVTETRTIKPTDLSVLQRSSTPNLTLITCYPVGTTLNRLVVTAVLSEGLVGSIQVSEPYLGEKLTTAR